MLLSENNVFPDSWVPSTTPDAPGIRVEHQDEELNT